MAWNHRAALEAIEDEEADFRADRISLPDREERHDRFRPATAGLLSGVLGGGVLVAAMEGLQSPLLSWATARWLGQWQGEPWARPAAAAGVVLLSALVGAFYASVTRRLRRFVPASLWAIVFFVSSWIGVDAILVAHGAPLARVLPVAPVTAIVAAFAFVLALHIPMRVRR